MSQGIGEDEQGKLLGEESEDSSVHDPAHSHQIQSDTESRNKMNKTSQPCNDLHEYSARLQSIRTFESIPFLNQWQRLLQLSKSRRSLPENAPLVTVLLGPTGAGKSTICNILLGQKISQTGAVRPCTRNPMACGNEQAIGLLTADPLFQELQLQFDTKILDPCPPSLEQQLFVDSPDFDSVEAENQRIAEFLMQRADRIIFVVTPDKYADASVWDAIDKILPFQNLSACIFNKSSAPGPIQDFSSKIKELGLAEPVELARLAQPDDLSSIDTAAIEKLQALLNLNGSPSDLLKNRLKNLSLCEKEYREQNLSPWLNELQSQILRAKETMNEFENQLPKRIENGLPLELDELLSLQLQERFMEKIEKYDFLREPRRWLSAPARWLASAIPFTSFGKDESEEKTPFDAVDLLTQSYGEKYHEFLLNLQSDIRQSLKKEEGTVEPSLPWPPVEEIKQEKITEALSGIFGKLQAEIEAESLKISENLSAAGKISFFGSQAVVHTVMIAVFVKTGGLSFGELAAQGLISPWVAKFAGQFVSSGEAQAVQDRLRNKFQSDLLSELLPILAPIKACLEQWQSILLEPSEFQQLCDKWEQGAASASE